MGRRGSTPKELQTTRSAWGRPAGVTTAAGSALGSNFPLACGTCPPTETRLLPQHLQEPPSGTTNHRPPHPNPVGRCEDGDRWGNSVPGSVHLDGVAPCPTLSVSPAPSHPVNEPAEPRLGQAAPRARARPRGRLPRQGVQPGPPALPTPPGHPRPQAGLGPTPASHPLPRRHGPQPGSSPSDKGPSKPPGSCPGSGCCLQGPGWGWSRIIHGNQASAMFLGRSGLASQSPHCVVPIMGSPGGGGRGEGKREEGEEGGRRSTGRGEGGEEGRGGRGGGVRTRREGDEEGEGPERKRRKRGEAGSTDQVSPDGCPNRGAPTRVPRHGYPLTRVPLTQVP